MQLGPKQPRDARSCSAYQLCAITLRLSLGLHLDENEHLNLWSSHLCDWLISARSNASMLDVCATVVLRTPLTCSNIIRSSCDQLPPDPVCKRPAKTPRPHVSRQGLQKRCLFRDVAKAQPDNTLRVARYDPLLMHSRELATAFTCARGTCCYCGGALRDQACILPFI